MHLNDLVNQDVLVDTHCQCSQHPSSSFCSVISIFDLVREEEQTASQCTTSCSQSDSFSGLDLVCDSGGSPAGYIILTCNVADPGLNTLRLCWP